MGATYLNKRIEASMQNNEMLGFTLCAQKKDNQFIDILDTF